MATSSQKGDGPKVPPTSSTVILMLATIGDTTWRLFVPTIGLTVIGLWLDKQWATTPWVMAAGIIVGSAIAFLLVRQQMKKVK